MTKTIVQWMEIVWLKMQCTNSLSPSQKSKGTCLNWRCWGRLEAVLLQSQLVIQKPETEKWHSPFNFLLELKKSTKENPKLTWLVLKVAPGYSNISKWYIQCLNEELLIATYSDQKKLLNKRTVLIAKCWHENKFLD